MTLLRSYLPDEPFSPPDRRRLRCEHLISRGCQPSPRYDDEITQQAWQFFHSLSYSQHDDSRHSMTTRFPHIADAHHFYTNAEPLRRAELEARLLANDADDQAIALKLGLSPETVAAYHDIYFDVRPFLDADVYIVLTVFGTKAHYGLTEKDSPLILKMLGYQMGSLVIDEYLGYLRDPSIPSTFDHLSLPELKRLRRKLMLKINILLMTTPAGALPPATWLELNNLASTKKQQGDSPGEAIQSAINVLDILGKAQPCGWEPLHATEAVPHDLAQCPIAICFSAPRQVTMESHQAHESREDLYELAASGHEALLLPAATSQWNSAAHLRGCWNGCRHRCGCRPTPTVTPAPCSPRNRNRKQPLPESMSSAVAAM